MLARHAHLPQVTHQHLVHALESDRLAPQRLRDVIGGLEDAGISEHDEDAAGLGRQQAHRGIERDCERAFAARERARDVEAVLRQERGQVVARDAARNVRDSRRIRSA